VFGVGCERAVDDVGEAAFEHAEGFAAAVALCSAAGDERLGLGDATAIG
jgi:hypothetical protein